MTGATTHGNADASRGESPDPAAAGPDADLPGYCLAHLSSKGTTSGGLAVRHYDLYPVEIPRPAHGQTTAAIVCGTCGKSLSCTVFSPAQMRRKRRRRLAAWLVVMPLGPVGGLAAFIASEVNWARPVSSILALALPVLGSCWVAVLFATEEVTVTGVKLRLRRDRLHSVRAPGETKFVEQPRGAEGA
jgi:hypothetical protein